MKIKYVKIEGIHCQTCINTITKELLKNKKIKSVNIIKNVAHITYDGDITNEEIIKIIINAGYITKDEYISFNLKDVETSIKLKEFIIIFITILTIWFLLNKIFGFNIFNVIPNIDNNITYGMLFVTGLLTSIHCTFMCGAINLVAITGNKHIKRSILYNLGRIISYTILGAFVGLLGSTFSVNNTFKGIIILVSALTMFLMGLNMLGIIHLKFLMSKLKLKIYFLSDY